MKNPFTPSFGQVPLQMAGRTQIIENMQAAFDNGVGDPNLCTLFTGARGTGKTALLRLLTNMSEERGWISVSATSTSDMLDDIYEQALRRAKHLIETSDNVSIKSISIGNLLGVEVEHNSTQNWNWRSRMTDLLESLSEQDVGLLIAVDEVDPKFDEIVRLTTVYQQFVGEGRKVSLLMAGLPHRISSLLNGRSISFLRRANRVKLGRIANSDVKVAFEKTVRGGGRTIEDSALDEAVRAIDGSPFMMQLVGYCAWNIAAGGTILHDDVLAGADIAKQDMKERVLEATVAELSDRDIDFLQAMLKDEKSSKTVDIAKRIGMTTGNVSTYKKRLLEQGVIEESRRGEVKFALPYLREYIDEYCD